MGVCLLGIPLLFDGLQQFHVCPRAVQLLAPVFIVYVDLNQADLGVPSKSD